MFLWSCRNFPQHLACNSIGQVFTLSLKLWLKMLGSTAPLTVLRENSCVSTHLHFRKLSNNTNLQAMIHLKLFSYAKMMWPEARQADPQNWRLNWDGNICPSARWHLRLPWKSGGGFQSNKRLSLLTFTPRYYWRSLAGLSAARNLCSLSCCMASFVSCANFLQSSPCNRIAHLRKEAHFFSQW